MEQESVNKQYISIIRFLEHLGIDISNWTDNVRIKKLANAEFNMSQNGFIEIDGFAYSKEDVLKELDATNWAERLELHQKIYSCKSILNFLERNKANWAGLQSDFEAVQLDDKFDSFFSPYFAIAFNNVTRICLNRELIAEQADLLQYRDFILPQHQEEGYKTLRLFLEDNIKVIKNISQENYDIMKPKMLFWLKPNWHLLLNNLPDDFFVYRDDLVHLLINLTVQLQFKSKADAIAISNNLIALQGLNPEHKRIIESNHSAYIGNSNYNNSNNKSSSEGGVGKIIWGIIWVIFIFVRVGNSCNKSKSYDDSYRYTPPKYYPSNTQQGTATTIEDINEMPTVTSKKKNKNEIKLPKKITSKQLDSFIKGLKK